MTPPSARPRRRLRAMPARHAEVAALHLRGGTRASRGSASAGAVPVPDHGRGVQGADYAGTRLPEAGTVRAHGGEIVLLTLLEGRSTTRLPPTTRITEGDAS